MRNPTEHFYNEIYSYYYSTIARLINLAINGELTPEIEEAVLHETNSFSVDLVIERLHVLNEWFLMNENMTRIDGQSFYETDLQCESTRPVTLLEKRWLKSIISDPRIQLFDIDFENRLDDVEPIFDENDFILIGSYADGDNYSDEEYIRNFRTVLRAIKEGWALKIKSENSSGVISPSAYTFIPDHLEYSELEDKFSLFGLNPEHHQKNSILRLNRIHSCELCPLPEVKEVEKSETSELMLLLNGEKARTQNVLERMLIEFSHHDKSVEETEAGEYLISINYLPNEEKELLVCQLLPFAHYIQVIRPESIKNEISRRILNQQTLFEKGGCAFFPNK